MELKVLHVVAGMDPKLGGVSQAIQTMIAGLSKKGTHNEVVCLETPAVTISHPPTVIIHKLGPTKSGWNYSEKLLPWLDDNLNHFDIVIIHGLWLFTSFAVRKAIKKLRSKQSKDKQRKNKGPKFYVMPHGMLDPYFQKATGRKLKALRNFIYWKLIESKVVNEANGILFTSDEEQFLAKKSFQPYCPKKLEVVGLGVDRPPAYTASMSTVFFERCPQAANQPYLLFLSRIHEKKGVDILINSYKILIEKNPELSKKMQKIVIAGPGLESEYGQRMHEIVTKNRELRENIFFAGMLEGDVKWGAFYESEAFILISHQENFGIAVVESLACGKPTLISNKINIWREISDAKAGIVANDTCEGGVEILKKWLTLSEGQKTEMGAQANSLYKNKFSVDIAANRLLEVL